MNSVRANTTENELTQLTVSQLNSLRANSTQCGLTQLKAQQLVIVATVAVAMAMIFWQSEVIIRLNTITWNENVGHPGVEVARTMNSERDT